MNKQIYKLAGILNRQPRILKAMYKSINQKISRINKYSIGIILFVLVYSCQQVQTDWTTESTDKKHVSWNGSWDNSDKLKLLYHGVKIFNEKDNYVWAFKVKLTYFKNYSDDTLGTYEKEKGLWRPPTSDLCIPVDKITYEIYDKDDFLIDSMSVVGNCISYTDTAIFQSKKNISKDLIAKYKYGKLNLKAGYYLKNYLKK